MIHLFIEGPPVVWRAPYVGSRGAYSPKHQEKKLYQHILRQKYSGPILTDIVRVDCLFFIPIPKAYSKKKLRMIKDGTLRPTAGGDLTNLRKFIEDCLQEIVIENDKQIVEGETAKYFDVHPRTVIKILPVSSFDAALCVEGRLP